MFKGNFKKIRNLGTIILLCTVLVGCGKKEMVDNENLGNEYVEGVDSQYMYTGSPEPSDIISTSKGYYIATGMYLYFIDKESNNQIILCNKPNCLHDKQTDLKKKFDCNAFLYMGNQNGKLFYYDENIYAISSFNNNKNNKLQFVKIKEDGSERKVLYEFEGEITQAILHRGYLYFNSRSFEEKEKEEGYTSLVTNSSKILRIPVNKKNPKPEEIFRTNLYQDGISKLIAFGNNVYIEPYGYEDENLEKDRYPIIRYDITTGEAREILKDDENAMVSISGIHKSKLVYSKWYYDNNDERNKQSYICDLDGTNGEIFIKVDSYGWARCDDKYIYNDNTNNRSDVITGEKKERIIDFYNEYGNKVDSLNLGKEESISTFFGTIPGDEKYLFLEYEDDESFNIKVIEKEDIGSKDIKVKDFFRVDLESINNEIAY